MTGEDASGAEATPDDATRVDVTRESATRDDASDDRTLGGMSHTNPYTDEVFGNTQTYSRGKSVAADGGAANATPSEPETLADVSHTPPDETGGAQRAYDRGVRHE